LSGADFYHDKVRGISVMEYRNTFVALFVALGLLAGCDPKRDTKPCLSMGSGSDLVTGAQLTRIDVYGASVHCNGAVVAAGSGAPDSSKSFSKGQKVSLDIAPGQHTFELTTFSDAAGMIPLGEGCTEANVTAGSRLCFDPTLKAVAACRSNADCAGTMEGTVSTPDCDTTAHRCVQCLDNGECGAGGACCDGSCVDTMTDKANCGACGKACTGDGVCCTGGCATLASDAPNCGMCGMACSTSHIAAACSAGACSGTCSPGYVDCNADKRGDGCECAGNGCCLGGTACQNAHNNGFGGFYYDCDPVGTYDAGHATAAALSAGGKNLFSSHCANSSMPDQEWQDYVCADLPNGKCGCWTWRAQGVSVMWVGTLAQETPCNCANATDTVNSKWN